MIQGFNTNIRRRGVVFHVQTEDSGRGRPHVITHLFHHGTILASEKRSYADQLDAADLEAEVRKLMEVQHKAMLIRLRDGEVDASIEERLGADVFQATEAAVAEPSATTPVDPPPRPRRSAADPTAALFGDEKGLDGMVLDYLAEKARKRSDR